MDAAATGASSGGLVCGDGVVDGDEACDAGNDDPVDGCDGCALAPALQWIRLFDGPAHGWDNAQDVAFAADGSLLVVGSQEGAVDNVDPVVRKLGPDGALVWERSFDGPVGGTDFGFVVGRGVARAVLQGARGVCGPRRARVRELLLAATRHCSTRGLLLLPRGSAVDAEDGVLVA